MSTATAILVHIEFPQGLQCEDLIEFKLLVKSAGVNILHTELGTRRVPDAKYYMGSGKVNALKALAEDLKPDLVIINHNLSPSQTRDLELALKCRTIDRTELILDIFAQRAYSYEGKLQVELAQLEHLATRLVRGWTHLERQKGGIGLRGPGEKQLETDRRLLRQRVKYIKQRLKKVEQQRQQSRQARQRSDIPTVSLVGYTNAGKSTLFNALTSADVYAADQLFATLDPTHRRLEVPGFGPVILVDTVGFIRHLPHNLVAAFRSTLQETAFADLLLHVMDVTDDNLNMHTLQVEQVLKDIGADQCVQIDVFNKLDLMGGLSAKLELATPEQPPRVWISAKQKQGLDLLGQAIVMQLGGGVVEETLTVAHQDWNGTWAKLEATLYQFDAVLDKSVTEQGTELQIKVASSRWDKLCREYGKVLSF